VSVFTMNAYAEPAIVFKGEECVVVLLPPDADPIVLIGDKLQATVATAGRGDTPLNPAKLTCQGRHDFPLEYAVVQRQPCFLPDTPYGDLLTENGMAVFAPSGEWTAKCMFKNAKED
jgi:hypothetical protein